MFCVASQSIFVFAVTYSANVIYSNNVANVFIVIMGCPVKSRSDLTDICRTRKYIKSLTYYDCKQLA